MEYLLIPLLFALLILIVWTASRLSSRRHPRPCPTTLIPLLDNPFTARYHASILSRLDLSPGLSVLDAGCGPGLLTVPIAQAVGPRGSVFALDVQPEMIQRARQAAAQAGLTNITFLIAGVGEGVSRPPSTGLGHRSRRDPIVGCARFIPALNWGVLSITEAFRP
jgi:SAM-dependent methyltransferase